MRPPHRATAAITLALAGFVSTAGSAGAEPAPPTVTTVPELPAPPGQTVFVDNPDIVEGHPQSIDSWSRVPRTDALAVNFFTGTPQCYGVHADVEETTDLVTVKLRSGAVPEAAGQACIMIAVPGSLTVELDAPVGGRAVVSIT